MESEELKDPFGNILNTLLFISREGYSLSTLQLINETKGRYYVDRYARQMAKQTDFSELIPGTLVFWIGIGGAYEEKMRECGEENLRFPLVGFNQQFIDFLVHLDPEQPLLQYQGAVLTVYTGHFALKAVNVSSRPDMRLVIARAIAQSPDLQVGFKEYAPGMELPDDAEAMERLLEIPEVNKALNAIAFRFRDVYPLVSEHADMPTLRESYVEAEENIYIDQADYWAGRPIDAILKGLGGYLWKTFLQGVRWDMLDEAKKRKREVLTILDDSIPERAHVANEVLEQETPEELARRLGLTQRQEEVMRPWIEGYSQTEIAEMLGISVSAVCQHVKAIEKKVKKQEKDP